MIDPDKRQKLEKRVRRIRAFYSSLITFVFVNILLMVINLLSNPHNLWFYWVTIIWGVVLIVQAVNTFTLRDHFLGEEWERKKMNELLEKEKEKGDKTDRKPD